MFKQMQFFKVLYQLFDCVCVCALKYGILGTRVFYLLYLYSIIFQLSLIVYYLNWDQLCNVKSQLVVEIQLYPNLVM